jgi:hypothetical protein
LKKYHNGQILTPSLFGEGFRERVLEGLYTTGRNFCIQPDKGLILIINHIIPDVKHY